MNKRQSDIASTWITIFGLQTHKRSGNSLYRLFGHQPFGKFNIIINLKPQEEATLWWGNAKMFFNKGEIGIIIGADCRNMRLVIIKIGSNRQKRCWHQ